MPGAAPVAPGDVRRWEMGYRAGKTFAVLGGEIGQLGQTAKR